MVSNELRWKGTGAVCVAGYAPPAGSGCQSDMGPVHGHTSGNRSVKGTKKRPNYGHTIIETNKNPRCHSNWLKSPLYTYQHMCRMNNGCGIRRSLRNYLSGPPSKVHSAASLIPQSHHLRLSVLMLWKLTPLSLRFILLTRILIQWSAFVNRFFKFCENYFNWLSKCGRL